MVINRKKLNVCFHLKKDNIIYFSEPEDCREERAGTELKKTNKSLMLLGINENVSLSQILGLCLW